MFAHADPLYKRKPSLVDEVCRSEAERQQRELILIASESICLPECAQTAASELGNIYAEGQADLRLSRTPRALALDAGLFHAWHRRLSDGRFYRGCREADRIELLARAGLAQAFARLPGSPPAERIHANVQALSGAAANLAVYEALLEPGDALAGLDLSHGGHLSHGSPFNVSGKRYRVETYGIDEQAKGEQRRLDYDRIRETVRRHRPKILVGGSSAYPWDWDWKTLRAIADENECLLMADVAHLAGMIFGGVLANPLPHAHVVTFTTHKTLCGPRGACIATACAETAKKIDLAVFPGLQGGPHVDSIAGIARLFEIVNERYEEYARLQRAIVGNARVLASALAEQGFTLEYGGTNTHLMLVDLKPFKTQGAGVKMDGETASRLLENAGIVCNKNTLPGDVNAGQSSGLRFGTPWVTQRGIGADQLRALAKIVRDLLGSAKTFAVFVPAGDERCRAKVPFGALTDARARAAALAADLPYPRRGMATTAVPAVNFASAHGRAGLLVRGEKARLALDQALSCPVLPLAKGQTAHGFVLRPDGSVLDDVLIAFLGAQAPGPSGPNGEEHFALLVHDDCTEALSEWLQALSDGYIELDPGDPYVKVDGPFAVEPLPKPMLPAALEKAAEGKTRPLAFARAAAGMFEPSKIYFVGQQALKEKHSAPARKPYLYTPPEGPLKKTVLHAWHAQHGAKMVPFGGWEMPVQYAEGIFAEHAAVRSAAGLFDVSHMAALEVSGPQALGFLETVFTNAATRLVPGEAQYSYMLYPDGSSVDDLYVYKISAERYMVVVNAGNAERDLDWLNAVNRGAFVIDPANPGKRAPGPVTLRALRDAGAEALIDLAFQGPLSATILAELADRKDEGERILSSRLNDFFEALVGGIPLRIAHTGYTGEETGFELFVHPDRAVELWELLLKAGKDRGVRPCGLGARDSLRIEAGFPLFGHEIEGEEKLSLTEADYGFVSRFHVPFYIGREAYIRRNSPRKRRLLRLHGSGRRSVRAGHSVLDADGKPIGVVTSFAFSDASFNYHVLAAVPRRFNPEPGTKVRLARATREEAAAGALDEGKLVDLTVLPRFPSKEEKERWAAKYGNG